MEIAKVPADKKGAVIEVLAKIKRATTLHALFAPCFSSPLPFLPLDSWRSRHDPSTLFTSIVIDIRLVSCPRGARWLFCGWRPYVNQCHDGRSLSISSAHAS